MSVHSASAGSAPTDTPAADTLRKETIEIPAVNGEPLVINRFSVPSGTGEDPRGVILICPAIATEARFYRALASWFAGHNYIAYTFDLQGYGASARTPLKDVTADFVTWTTDARQVVDYVADMERGREIHYVGHSLGGQLLAFVDHDALTSATIVAAGVGYHKFWRHYGATGWAMPIMWRGIAPAVVKLAGYYPGSRIKILGDLPGPVMRQWAHWCTLPRYMLTEFPEFEELFANYSGPLDFITVSDDEIMPLPASLSLMGWYSRADLHHTHYEPGDLGVERLGHMTVLHKKNKDLWPKLFAKFVD